MLQKKLSRFSICIWFNNQKYSLLLFNSNKQFHITKAKDYTIFTNDRNNIEKEVDQKKIREKDFIK